jgi:hypothetical protein
MARFQANVLIDQYATNIPLFDNVPRIFMPLFWMEQKFVLEADKARLVKLALKAPETGRIFGIVLLVLGIILLLLRFVFKTVAISDKSKLSEEIVNVRKDDEINPLVNQ